MVKVLGKKTNTDDFDECFGIDKIVIKGAELYDKQVDKAENRLLASVKAETNTLKAIYITILRHSSFNYKCMFKFNLNGKLIYGDFIFEDDEKFTKILESEIAKIIFENISYKIYDNDPRLIKEIFKNPI